MSKEGTTRHRLIQLKDLEIPDGKMHDYIKLSGVGSTNVEETPFDKKT